MRVVCVSETKLLTKLNDRVTSIGACMTQYQKAMVPVPIADDASSGHVVPSPAVQAQGVDTVVGETDIAGGNGF